MEEVNGFTMLPSYYEALRPLPDEMRLPLYDAVFDYAFTGKTPEGLSPVLNGYFQLMRPNIDSSIRHYAASVENGKKGGRPQKKPDENPAKTQDKPGENRDKEKEKDKDKETETEKECERERETVLPPPADTLPPEAVERHKYGDYGWVRLTNAEYSRLVTELGPTELARCISYLDTSAQSTGNKNRWKDWNLVIRRCHREGWGMGTSSTLTGNGQRQKSFSEIIAERTGSNRPSTNPFLDLLEAESQQQADDKYDLVGYFEKMEDGKK